MKKIKSTTRNVKRVRTASILLAAGVFALPIILTSITNAQSVGDLRAQSAALQDKIEANSAEAEKLDGQADTLRNRIAGIDLAISIASDKIALTNSKIETLEKELVKTQKELKRQKALLKVNILALYKRGDASSVELIASSEDFSGYIDEQEYLERIKVGIQESAQKVMELEKEIKSKRDEQKELLEQQEAAKNSLDQSRAERSNLLAQTEGQEAQYRGVVADLQEKRAEVEEALTAKILAANYSNLGSAGSDQVIGRVGMTGFTFGPHLHFELRDSGFKTLNPGGYPLSGMTWPVPGNTSIAQYYGCVPESYYATPCAGGGSLHTGLDIPAGVGSPIVAAKPGVIIHRGDDGDGYGIKIIMKHNDGTYTLYAHTSP